MNDALKALLALGRPDLAKFLDHGKLITSAQFEGMCKEAVQDFKENGDTTILLRLIALFDQSPLKPTLVISLCKATGLRSYLKNGEVQLTKSDSTAAPAEFDLKAGLAQRPSDVGSRKPKKFKKSPQRAKGPKYPKLAGKAFDPYAPRGKNAVKFDTPKEETGGRYGKPAPKRFETAVPRGKGGSAGKFGKPQYEGRSAPADGEARKFAKPYAKRSDSAGAEGGKYAKPVTGGRRFYNAKTPRGQSAGAPKFGKPKFAGQKKR